MTADELDPVTGFDPYADAPADPEPERLARRIVLTKASDIKPRRVKWTWDGRIAEGTLSLLAGREGLGKSTLGYDIGARVSKGTLPGESYGTPRPVLVCATEDSWEHTIIPRLIAAGANRDLIYRVEIVTHDHLHMSISLPHDFAETEAVAQQIQPGIMLIDPLMSVIDARLDTHRDREVRQALEPLATLADRSHMAILGLIHHNKSASTDALQLVMASKAFTAVSRSVHTCIPDPDDETQTRRLFATSKNNLGRTDLPVLGFVIDSHPVDTEHDGIAWTGKIKWTGEVQGSMHEIMTRSADPERSATAEASDWLRDYLETQGGTAAKADIEKAGRGDGHTVRTLARARERLRIAFDSKGFPRRTYWTLPDTATAPTSPTVPKSDDWGPETPSRANPLGTTAKPDDNGTLISHAAITDTTSRATVMPTLAPLGTTGPDQAKHDQPSHARARRGRHDVGTTEDMAPLTPTVVPVVPNPPRARHNCPHCDLNPQPPGAEMCDECHDRLIRESEPDD